MTAITEDCALAMIAGFDESDLVSGRQNLVL
jgi:hypothetical protein